ncbi:unnamed protein product [Lactuca saligna]|uniref:Myb/SANT-like domain-containing protein n=1 Tax=Lactuca saligna TaxID=75948 RepID=A0AA35YRK3_LACSI|nr:unnamed protein product [Lactuca saligna]
MKLKKTPLKVCVTSSVCEAQTTRRHNGLQSVCFSEVRRHKNVCARSSPHRYGIASSKVCKPFNLKKNASFFFLLPPPVLVQPSQKKPSIDRSCSTLQRPPPSQPSSPIKAIDCRLPLRSGVLRFSDHHSRLQQPANNNPRSIDRSYSTLLAAVNQRLPCEATGRKPSPPQLHRRLRPHRDGRKQQWTNEHLKCLLDTCIEEVESVGRKGLSLQKDSWIRLGRVLKEKFGVELTQKQMKNAYDNLKAKYTGWGHPKAASLRTIPLPFPDLCAHLFDGNSATGNFRSYSTQSSSVAGASSCRVPPLQITATPFDAMDDDGVDTSHHEPPPSAASPSAGSPSAASPSAGSPYTSSPYTATPSGNPNKRAKPSTPVAPSASPSASSPDGTSVTADDLAFEMKKALQSLTKGYTIPQCLEKLEVLQLGPTDPLRFVAYHIFGGTMNMREMWMHLPDVPEILRGWHEMTGTSLGVLKDGKIVR